jgi:hypothetical protein
VRTLIARYRLWFAYLMGPVGLLDVERPMVNPPMYGCVLRPGVAARPTESDGGLIPAGYACWMIAAYTIAAEHASNSHEISTPWHFIGTRVEHYQVPKTCGKRDKRPEGGDLVWSCISRDIRTRCIWLSIQFAPQLFARAGLPSATASFLASGVSAISMFAISILTFVTVDKFGRRTIVISGGRLLMFCMLVVGSLYASDDVVRIQGAGRWVVIVLILCRHCISTVITAARQLH